MLPHCLDISRFDKMTNFPYKFLQRAHKGRPPEKKQEKEVTFVYFLYFLERKMPDNFKKNGRGSFSVQKEFRQILCIFCVNFRKKSAR